MSEKAETTPQDEGGRYVVDEKSGERKRVDKPQRMPEGGGARDAKGELLHAGEETPQPAMPEPPKAAPWETPKPSKAADAEAPAAARKGA